MESASGDLCWLTRLRCSPRRGGERGGVLSWRIGEEVGMMFTGLVEGSEAS